MIVNKARKDKAYLYGVILYLVLYFFIQCFWLCSWMPEDSTMAMSFEQGKDALTHGSLVAEVLVKVENSGFRDFLSILSSNINYPPLYHLVIACSYLLLGKNFILAMHGVSIFLAVLVLFVTFLIGSRYSSDKVGFFSCILLSLFPQFYKYVVILTPHMAVVLATSLSLYLLYRSQYFRNLRYSIMFGLVFGLSLYVKHEVLIFIIPALIYVLICAFKRREKYFLRNILLSLTVFSVFFVIFFLIYIVPDFGGLYHRMRLREHQNIVGKSVFSFSSLMFYIWIFFNIQLHKIIAVFSLFSAMLFFRNKYIKDKLLLLVYIVAPIGIFTFIPAKWPEYAMPILPMVAVIIIGGVFSIRRKKISMVLAISLLLFSATTFIQHMKNYPRKFLSIYGDTYSNNQNKIIEQVYSRIDTSSSETELCYLEGVLGGDPIEVAKLLRFYGELNFQCKVYIIPLLDMSYPMQEIGMKNMDYVLYRTKSKNLQWPTLGAVKARYGKLAILDPKVGEEWFLEIVNAREYFTEINRFQTVFRDRITYYYLYKNIVTDSSD